MTATAILSVIEATRLSHWATLGRLGAALGLGALIGLQREIDGHDAGIRTHALLTLGSALFGLLSIGAFNSYIGLPTESNIQIDVTRIASYLVAGVGFLAGGAIVRHGDRVKGLTTAASMWVSAGVGLAAGLGSMFSAVVATVATLGVLVLERPIARLSKSKQSVTVRVLLRSAAPISDVVREIEELSHHLGRIRRVETLEGRTEITVSGLPVAAQAGFIDALQARPDLVGLSYDVR